MASSMFRNKNRVRPRKRGAAKRRRLLEQKRRLIALGVSAQIPCHYCVLAHASKARKLGASEEEIKEALAVASMVRKWSTVLNGANYDMNKFKAEIGLPTN